MGESRWHGVLAGKSRKRPFLLTQDLPSHPRRRHVICGHWRPAVSLSLQFSAFRIAGAVAGLALLLIGHPGAAVAQKAVHLGPVVAMPTVEVVSTASGAIVDGAATGFGALNLGNISWARTNAPLGASHTKDRDSFSITTTIGLRLNCPAIVARRYASIAAILQQPDSRYVVFFDQIPLSAGPTEILPLASCGSVTQHTLQLKVPTSARAGPISANIGFQVTLH
jgi:hypothetical protein